MTGPRRATTLHILRSAVADDVRELVELSAAGETCLSLAGDEPDYDELLRRIFLADRVICWW